MNAAILVLSLLFCVAVSAVIVRMLRLPLPLTQIALGAAVGLPDFGLHLDFDPHLFLLLFVPPLLFVDGWRMPKREFLQMRGGILGLAFGLVLATVVAVGYLLHWIVPQMPLAIAFALAAVLSPTDAVAVTAIAGRAPIPRRIVYLLQGEALMNDASGLTSFKFAVAATLTGSFSLAHASAAFVLVSIGGLAIGTACGWALAIFQQRLAGWTRIEAQGSIVMVLLLPFAAYLVAEKAGTSGILAAVAAGVTMNLKSSLDPAAETRVVGMHLWQMLEYTLNGAIFVVLGLQLPGILGEALGGSFDERGVRDAIQLIAYAVVTFAALILVRLSWIYAAVKIIRRATQRRGVGGPPLSGRLIWAMTLAGVRGAVTLAGVLSVPLVLEDGTPFPMRSLMIFICASVILMSLIAAAAGLPWLLRTPIIEDDTEEREERAARIRGCEAAIAAVAAVALAARAPAGAEVAGGDADAPTSALASRVIEDYQQRLDALREPGAGPADGPTALATELAADIALRLAGVRAERAELVRLHRADQINDVVFDALLYEFDTRESTLVPHRRQH